MSRVVSVYIDFSLVCNITISRYKINGRIDDWGYILLTKEWITVAMASEKFTWHMILFSLWGPSSHAVRFYGMLNIDLLNINMPEKGVTRWKNNMIYRLTSTLLFLLTSPTCSPIRRKISKDRTVLHLMKMRWNISIPLFHNYDSLSSGIIMKGGHILDMN